MRGIALVVLFLSGTAEARPNLLAGQPCCRTWSQAHQTEVAVAAWAQLGDGVARDRGGALHVAHDVARAWGLDLDVRTDHETLAGAHGVVAVGHADGLGFFDLALVAGAEVGWETAAIALAARVFLASKVSLDLGARALYGHGTDVELGLGWWLP
jgi:hypothetical protein